MDGDKNCGCGGGVRGQTVLIPHPQTSQLTVSVGEGGVRVRGMGYHAPTPQAGRVTDSDRRGRVREGWGEGGMKHSNIDNKRCRRMRGINLSAIGECAE
jgi:hypothetical protein